MLLNGVMLGRAFGATLDDTKKSLQSLSDSLKQAQERQRQFNQSLERFGAISTQTVSQLNRSLERFGAVCTQTVSQLNQSRLELEINQERLASSQSRQETLRESHAERTESFQEIKETFSSVMAPIVASVTRYASFEAQLRDISVAHGMSSEQEKEMGQRLRQYSQQVNQTPDALLSSAGQLLDNRMSQQQATDVAAVLGKTSTASGAALSDLTALATTLDDVFNLKGAKALEESFSRMLAGTKQGFSMASMTQYATELAPGFTAMGARGNQALSQLVSSLSATKGEDTEANTAARLGSFMNAMGRTDIADSYYNAGMDYNASLKSYMKGGYSQYDASVLVGTELIDSKGSQFRKQWEMASNTGNVGAQQNLMQRYGLQEVFRTPEAVNHALSMKQNWASYQSNQQVMNSPAATQTLNIDFAQKNDTLTGRWQKMTTSLLNIALNVGEALVPVLVSLSDALIPILEQLVTWTAENPELVRGIVVTIAGLFMFGKAVSGVKQGVSTLLSSFQEFKDGILRGWQWLKTELNLKGLWRGIRSALSGLGSRAGTLLGRIFSIVWRRVAMMAIGAVMTMLTTPVGWVVAAVVGVVAAIVGIGALIYKYSDQIAELWNQCVSKISNFFNSPMETVSNAIPDGIKNFFSSGPSEELIANNNQAAAVLAPTPVSALSLDPTPRIESPSAESNASSPQQRVARTPTVGGAKGKLVSAAPSERVQVAFSPTIYLNGQKAAPTPEMTKTLTLSMNELENMLNKLLIQRERRGYA
ncbi:phage tail tape measure protein [Pectobacterium versatile]|uniref:phage tail tape measure protein n=1 Tax=Pectobacterium versatile TaxID=2488639 RepID=UPI00166119FF|nr:MULTISPECIES: phage tail tape measure protein [Pectobacterium]MBD0847377.1 tail protein [Pectobacterium carotovorum subsp. carotovorum]MBK4825634.1 putative tape measure protein [Pectobacterium carotovorum subsp. carotovorum]UNE80605.1 phage tail tape measure protein [Pectobacterium versatile]